MVRKGVDYGTVSNPTDQYERLVFELHAQLSSLTSFGGVAIGVASSLPYLCDDGGPLRLPHRILRGPMNMFLAPCKTTLCDLWS